MKSIDHSFYSREAWKQVRLAYLKKKRFICERCGGIAKWYTIGCILMLITYTMILSVMGSPILKHFVFGAMH